MYRGKTFKCNGLEYAKNEASCLSNYYTWYAKIMELMLFWKWKSRVTADKEQKSDIDISDIGSDSEYYYEEREE